MAPRILLLPAALARLGVRLAVGILVVAIAIGVSVPAQSAAPVKPQRSEGRGDVHRRLRESSGERGYVRRRNDIIRKETHVEKRRGWRSIE